MRTNLIYIYKPSKLINLNSSPINTPQKPLQLHHKYFSLSLSLISDLSLTHNYTNTRKMGNHRSPLLIALVSVFFYSSVVLAAPVTYNVVSLGAKGDGKTDSTRAFLAAWTKACASVSPVTIYVPAGRFYLRQVVFNGPCRNKAIFIRIDATLVAPSDYRVLGNSGNWLIFRHVTGVTLSGGILDGQGTGLWACKASGKSCPTGATVR
jgi:polygalacturonase